MDKGAEHEDGASDAAGRVREARASPDAIPTRRVSPMAALDPEVAEGGKEAPGGDGGLRPAPLADPEGVAKLDSSLDEMAGHGISPRSREQAALLLLQERLAHQVSGVLDVARRATDPGVRSQLLGDLLRNCALRVANDIRDRVAPVAGAEEDLRYYHVLAEYFASEAGHGAASRLQPVSFALWSHDAFPALYTLLFHQWLFAAVAPSSEPRFIHRYNVSLKGAFRLLWTDVHYNTGRFARVFEFFKDNVMLNPNVGPVLPLAVQDEARALTFRFFLHYTRPEALAPFLGAVAVVHGDDPGDSAPPTLSAGGDGDDGDTDSVSSMDSLAVFESLPSALLDTFADEVSAHVLDIRAEAPAVHYVRAMQCMRSMRLSPRASNRVQSAIHALTAPGGPYFPPGGVRRAARETYDELFPTGRLSRRAIRLVFRLLHPYYWPGSVWHWARSQAIGWLEWGERVLLRVPLLGPALQRGERPQDVPE